MRAALILAAFVAGCGFDPSGLGEQSTQETGAPTDATAKTDAGFGDPLPEGAISYFRGATCPSGWSPYEPTRGRFVVATIGAVATGRTAGAPLASGEDRMHQHSYALTFNFSSQSYVGASGGSNGGVGSSSGVAIAGMTEPASSGLPYVQLLVCRKNEKPIVGTIPSGMQLFFASTTCPSGFTQTEATQGRFVVGLPKGAAADQTFGRGAGSSGTHFHAARADLTTKPHGIALFSGCCADGYAKNGAYSATGNTEESTAGLPTIELLSCTKT